MVADRFGVFLVNLDPVKGAETSKTRPCVVVSPDEMNRALATVIIAPMTTVKRDWPTRIPLKFRGKSGDVALDQIRTIDKTRLLKRLGRVDNESAVALLDSLAEMFAP